MAYIGMDVGDFSHAIALHAEGARTSSTTLEHSSENLHAWLEGLEKRFNHQPVAIAVEGMPRAVLAVLWQYTGWLSVYSVHPAAGAGHRQMVKPSGAKNDTLDATLILSMLEKHRAHLWLVEAPADLDQRLSLLTVARRKIVDQRTALTNQLKALLKKYFPQALQLSGTVLHGTLARDFLSRWPDLASLQRAHAGTVRAFYLEHRVRDAELIDERLKLIASARALTRDAATIEVSTLQLRLLLDQLATLARHLQVFDQASDQVYATHPDRLIYDSLPGAGPALAPRLAVAMTTRRDRFASAASFQRYSGIAPILRESGRTCIVTRRRAKPTFLHQTLLEWAGLTVQTCPWARAYYQLQLARGKRHWEALRSLAFKWIHILWKCWQTHTPYDDARYLQALKQQNSPLLPLIQPIPKRKRKSRKIPTLSLAS